MNARRLRMAFVYDALYPYVKGGGERRYHELGLRLRDRHDVHFVSWQWWDGPARWRREGITFHGVGRPPNLYGTDGKRTVREAAAFSARLPRVLLRERFDVIDCAATPYLPLYSAWLASRITRSRLIATWHEYWADHWHDYLPDRPLVATLAQRIEAGSRRLGDQLVAVSDFTARRMGRPGDDRLIVVGNGVALDEIDAVPATPGAPELIYVGRLIDEKRVDLLLEAMHLLRDRFPSLRCAIVGEGPTGLALRQLASALGLDGRVEFRGQLDGAAVYGLIKGATLLVLPSVREGFGMTVAEAQACGTVPLAVRSAASGAPDLIRDGVDGVLADATPAALADGMARVLEDPDRQRSMAANARQSGAARDWDPLASRMEAIYHGERVGDTIAAPAGASSKAAGDTAAALR